MSTERSFSRRRAACRSWSMRTILSDSYIFLVEISADRVRRRACVACGRVDRTSSLAHAQVLLALGELISRATPHGRRDAFERHLASGASGATLVEFGATGGASTERAERDARNDPPHSIPVDNGRWPNSDFSFFVAQQHTHTLRRRV